MLVYFQKVLLRIHVHEIAAICYIRDDNQHILAIKYGMKYTALFYSTTTDNILKFSNIIRQQRFGVEVKCLANSSR